MDAVASAAVERVEQAGIIFVDEIDKIAGREGSHGPEVSREGVQRDILPIVEGTTVNTKHGMVRTDHILFIAAGAFHVSKPSDLIPELQGRFPIRVELEALGQAEFVRILTEPRSALIKQYMALMATEGVDLQFTEDGVATIAEFATIVNERTENIGARRLHTVMERLLDEVSFEAPNLHGQVDHDRRGLRAPHARGHRQERRPVALHPVTHSTRDSRAARANRSLRAGLVVLAVIVTAVACGKKGPPLAPFVRVPALVADVTPQRVGRRRLPVVHGAGHQRRRPEAGRHRRGRGLRGHVRRGRRQPKSSARSRRCRHAAGAADPAGAAGAGERHRRRRRSRCRPASIAAPRPWSVKEITDAESRVAVELPVDRPIPKARRAD